MQKLSRLLLIILFSLCLQACAPAIFVTGAAVGISSGIIINDLRPAKVILQDQSITHDLQMKLSQDNRFKSAHIAVTSFNRIVLLVGQTPTQELRDLAETDAKSISNVRMVHNEITIGYPTSFATRTNDTWITTEIKTILVAKPGLKSSQIKIVTENGTVYLMGLIKRDKADEVVDEVRRVDGVQKVVKLFEYIQ